MSANLTTGNLQSYTFGEGLRIIRGTRPDIVMIQEFNYASKTEGNNTPGALKEFMIRAGFERGYFVRESEPMDSIPNGILSRFPIVEAGEWRDSHMANRDFIWARIELPNKERVLVVSVHLYNGSPGVRADQARTIMNRIKSVSQAHDHVIVGGDFNTKTPSERAIKEFCVFVCQKAHARTTQGSYTTSMGGTYPYDWIFVSPSMQARMIPVQFGQLAFPDGLVFDSTSFPSLNLVPPILKSDSRAPGMQHLAVIKDFAMP